MLAVVTNEIAAVVKQPIGGDMLVEQCRLMCEEQKIEVVPTYKIQSKVQSIMSTL